MAEMHAEGVSEFGQAHDFERQTRRAGAVISAALIAGLVWWGGTLVLRDVTDVPVIAAEQNEFRTEPADPGGQVATHQGLAVTQVASEGTQSAEVNEVFIAPNEDEIALPEPGQSAEVAAEDLRGESAINAAVTLALGGDVDEAADPAFIEESAASEETASEETASEETAGEEVVGEETVQTAMLRPRLRPQTLHLAAASAVASPQEQAQAQEQAEPSTPPSATPLSGPMVQLGAYDSAAIAEDVRERLYSRFGGSFSGRPYFVMEAVVSGRTYHRLRVGGFESRSDANRFCQLMEAEGVDCVPVSG